MKKPAAQTSKTPLKKKPAASGGASSSLSVKRPAGSDAALSSLPVEKKPPGSGGELSKTAVSKSTAVAPQTPASDATTRHLGSPFQDVTSEAELLAPAGLLLDWDGFSSEEKLQILKQQARENPPPWLPSAMDI